MSHMSIICLKRSSKIPFGAQYTACFGTPCVAHQPDDPEKEATGKVGLEKALTNINQYWITLMESIVIAQKARIQSYSHKHGMNRIDSSSVQWSQFETIETASFGIYINPATYNP